MIVSSRDKWLFDVCTNIMQDKEALLRHYITNMLDKTTRIFKYNNLPDTIPQKDFEIIMQVGGFAIMKNVEGKHYAFRGGLGGKPNPYYLPTIATVANPALNYSANLEIDKECVVILNDNFYQGLMPLLHKYGELLVEAEISLRYAIINARVPALVEADNDATAQSAERFFQKIVEGKDYGVISSKEFFDGIRSHDFYKQAYIKDIIESIQYIKGSAFNEIGLNAAFNMKREAINEFEAGLNEDILIPKIDTMLECRKIGLEKYNKMYDTNISVELDSVWAENRMFDELSIEEKEAEIEEILHETETEESDETESEEMLDKEHEEGGKIDED